MVDGNELGDVGFKKLGTPYSEMDCQAFVEWCLRQCGCNKDLPGSNAWYREVLKHGVILSPEDCVKELGCVPKGAFLFIHAFDGGEPPKYQGDGIGNASHIGLCTIPRGEGAIHSSASRGCVAESKFKQKTINGGWNKVGLWTEVAYDYSGGVTPTPEPTPTPTPEPTPEPTPAMTAIVGNVPEGKRQDVNLRKRPSTSSALVERVPVGETVEVLDYEDDWCKVKWNGYTGYIMTQFLIFDEPPEEDDYTVMIFGLSEDEAKSIHEQYPNSTVSVG